MRTLNLLSILQLPFLVISQLRPGILPKSFVEPAVNPPPWRIHAYNDNTYILRQSGLTDYEKPFLYILFGEEKVFLLDTGSL
jgi:hydroxyacylglutathione hydrolase